MPDAFYLCPVALQLFFLYSVRFLDGWGPNGHFIRLPDDKWYLRMLVTMRGSLIADVTSVLGRHISPFLYVYFKSSQDAPHICKSIIPDFSRTFFFPFQKAPAGKILFLDDANIRVSQTADKNCHWQHWSIAVFLHCKHVITPRGIKEDIGKVFNTESILLLYRGYFSQNVQRAYYKRIELIFNIEANDARGIFWILGSQWNIVYIIILFLPIQVSVYHDSSSMSHIASILLVPQLEIRFVDP